MAEKTRSSDDNRPYWVFYPDGTGISGVTFKPPKMRPQHKRAKPVKGYAVVFFPKVSTLPTTEIWGRDIRETFAATPNAAKVKFMDRLSKSCKWKQYHEAGHRIRKVKIIDLGDVN